MVCLCLSQSAASGIEAKMLRFVLVLALVCGCYASESLLPRCSDEVCRKDPHCVYHRGQSVCWDVKSEADEGDVCRCCQNCIAGTNVFIDEECHSNIRSCQTADCPKVKCRYNSYIPLCSCCQNCIPRGIVNLLHSQLDDCSKIIKKKSVMKPSQVEIKDE